MNDELIEALGTYSKDPLKFVLFAFPWGEGTLKGRKIEEWQYNALVKIRDGMSPSEAVRIAVASGNGIGKSAFVSWIILWAFTTFEDTRGVLTANTETQLKTKTWAELAKWFSLFIAKDLFTLEATALFSRDPSHKLTWRCDIIPWSEANYVAFQGLHNLGRRQFVIFDEAAGIADVIWDAAEGCMTDADTERFFFVFGNPNPPKNMQVGMFRECFGKFAHRWRPVRVDSRTVSFTDKELIRRWIEDYGEDSDFVRVRVKGEFARTGSMQFFDPAQVSAAKLRESTATYNDPLILAVDVARFGDDKTVLRFRRGQDARTLPPIKFRGADTMQVAAAILDVNSRVKPDMIFIDGGGPGAGVIDRCRMFKLPVTEIQFGAKADRSMIGLDDGFAYANKRAEMYGALREWLRHGAIDDDPELEADLLVIQYGYVLREGRDAIILEKKDDLRRQRGASTDDGDALALTFAYPVQPSDHRNILRRKPVHQLEYDPLSVDYLRMR